MAKQNFLNGGYIGKLGNTVGQRWKNQKIIRTYVKPSNPNTPAQQTARQQFAVANKLAQEAMNINGHQGIWDTSSKPEYSQRVGQAMRRLRLGYSEQDSLPLYPEGQSPAVNVLIQDVAYDTGTDSYKFTVNSFQGQNPLGAEITFYTPLNYGQGKYGENIIHATVDSATNSFTVDLSATNVTDGQTVKDLFRNSMNLGFCAMQATFVDMLGATLTNVSIQRRFVVSNKLYDFDETLPLIETSNKVLFTQAFAQNTVYGTIQAQATSGFPLISKVSSQASFYDGFADETLSTAFILQNSDAQENFPVPVNVKIGSLKSTDTTTYTLAMGQVRPQLYKDTSNATYPTPVPRVAVTDIVFAGNDMQLSLNQDVTASGATSCVISVRYPWMDTAGSIDILSEEFVGAILPGGTSVKVSSPLVARLAPAYIGDLALDFRNAVDQSIIAINPIQIQSVAGKFYYSEYADIQAGTATANLLSGKAIAGSINGDVSLTAGTFANTSIQVFANVTYADTTQEIVRGQGIYSYNGNDTPVSLITTTGVNKEILKAEYVFLTSNTDNQNGISYQSKVAVEIPRTITVTNASYSHDTQTASISIPNVNMPFITHIGGEFRAWENGRSGFVYDDSYKTIFAPGGSVQFDISTVGADSIEGGFPAIWVPKLFYADGTASTTISVNVPLPTQATTGMIVREDMFNKTDLNDLSANTSVSNRITFSSPSMPAGLAGAVVFGTPSVLRNVDGDDLAEFVSPSISSTATSVTFGGTVAYESGTSILVGPDGYFQLYWIADGKVQAVIS